MIASQSNIAIVILAAGASKRMGKPKQLLKWGEGTLISHAVKTASKVNPKDLIVVFGAHFELIKNEIETSKVTILNNQSWEKGLGTSIAFAIDFLQNSKSNIDGVLITLCDQPLITTDFLKSLVSKFQPNKKQIIATSYGNGKHGVPALFDKIYFEDLLILSDDQGAKNILIKYKAQVVSVLPPEKNIDLDTTEDYTNLYQSNFKK
ncbi:nucleotidyltransferase family protein [Confluentibacter flavum]|uniref:4-diphosphocytidyl-2C-methyl-D-erythritol synthase n=1 Tax=Confluentibacter flavum TaxID=1909700 RepID=A0A2N3HMX1_9FLAO|nr:nucleotidyltransferase family protein [Confluentibacter flavum]PKQ46281.1 4-diphosphocytidyl-2C-methyl-D-erythritol synthase [Confluentibacter flavum]